MESTSDNKRFQRRVEAAIPIQVRGLDASGTAYDDVTVAIEVSRRGLSFITRHELAAFALLTVVIPGRGPMRLATGPSDFFTEATVVRSVREGENEFRVGVRFMGATLPMYTSESR